MQLSALLVVLAPALAAATLDPATSNTKGKCPSNYACSATKVSKAIQAAECSHNTRTGKAQTFAVFETDHQYDASHGAPYGTCSAYTCDAPTQMLADADCWTFFWSQTAAICAEKSPVSKRGCAACTTTQNALSPGMQPDQLTTLTYPDPSTPLRPTYASKTTLQPHLGAFPRNHDRVTRPVLLSPGCFQQRRHLQLPQLWLHPARQRNLAFGDAISYTWASDDGKMECTGRINVDRREFLVTPNCMMALQRTRSRGAEKVIWIDAVCMNQKDTEQRGHQVQVMPQIYSRAQHVLIYVGELALEDESLLRMLQIDPVPIMPLQTLQLALGNLSSNDGTFRGDKLFAVFGLVSCADADGLVADYTKSTEETYMQMAGWRAQRFGVPAMLVRAFHLDQFGKPEGTIRPATSTSIPSWAPDWAETLAPRSWPVLVEMHRERRVGLAPAGLPMNVNLAANSLIFHVTTWGPLG
ncbi:putative heterokaryon incompatibility protein [Colletotrichum sublineola]|uniref:Putative heterokaryon incompatibility protein n=1 Tax=Colletotrichum sublineola TaxID=1173701 RepID=A0A066X339_COLSU|nr:putative heterokaryon incompatibility protein [Colletotrichum sublineola]